MVHHSAVVAFFIATGASVFAHPHERTDAELAFHSSARRTLATCQSQLRRRGGTTERSVARRQAFAEKIRKERSIPARGSFLKKRDTATVLATSHASNLTGLTAETDPSVLFSGNNSCVLGPEVTQGPYLVSGEYVRSDVREEQTGVPLYVDVELIDINTCQPVSGLYMDFWHANATGVYSGIVANGNGDDSDASNLNATFLRGIQPTDDNGVAQFSSVFPGHYTGRTEHIHILVHQTDGVLLANGTYAGSNVSHVGQLFFDEALITAVDAVAPYSTNTQQKTLNADDSIFTEEADDIDPMMEYVLLGDSVSDGILGWVTMGIDTTASYTASPAATLTENGGVADANSGIGGGGGAGGAPSGSVMPSDAMPSGSAAPSGASASGSAASLSVTRSGSAISSAASTSESAVASDVVTSGSSPASYVSVGQWLIVLLASYASSIA